MICPKLCIWLVSGSLYSLPWLKRYAKRNPDLAPKKKVPEEPKEEPKPEPTVTEQLLTEILAELKNKNASTNK